jgi:hypothetical protein
MFEPDRSDMTYKITANHWIEERADGWYVGQRIVNDDGQYALHGPCNSKTTAEILQAEMVKAFKMMVQETINAHLKRFGPND